MSGSNAVKKRMVAIPAVINDGHNIATTLCVTGISCIGSSYTKQGALQKQNRLIAFVRQTVNISSQNVYLGFTQKLVVGWHTSGTTLGDSLSNRTW